MKSLIGWIVLGVAALAVVGCKGKHEKPNFIYMPNMVYSPAIKAQEEGSIRPLPEGVIPRDHVYFDHSMDRATAARTLRNPIERTKANFLRGQEKYKIYCAVCHGTFGDGDGTITQKGFTPPPSFHTKAARNYADGHIFHIITKGQNRMKSYASQVKPDDRWAIVHYIRALQKAKFPSDSDLEKAAEIYQNQ